MQDRRESGLWRWYSLGVLTLVYALNQADRYIMSALLEPIKHDLGLSDAGVAFLSGVSLAIFYVIAGLWIAVIADRSNRRNIVSGSLAIWSGMTALCGATRTFAPFMFARIGVGIGEAGGTAPSHAIISDLFPARTRARALAIYGIGVSLGVALSSLGARLSEVIGWRNVFYVLGIPGVLLSFLVFFTVPEPVRGVLDRVKNATSVTLPQTLRYVFGQPSLRHQLFASFLFCLSSWGLIWWLPAFLVRSHGMTTGQAGVVLGEIHGLGGTGGLIGSVFLMRWLEKRPVRDLARAAAVLITVATVPAVVAVSINDTTLVIFSLWIFITLVYGMYGPTFALLQNSTPVTMRTQISALGLLIINIANLVAAPLAVGWASDLLHSRYGNQSLRIALIPLAAIGFWGAWHFWAAGKTLNAAMAAAGTDELEPTQIWSDPPLGGCRDKRLEEHKPVDKVYSSPADALKGVLFDGMTIMSGGFGLVGNPENLIAEIRNSGVRNLTIISNNCGADGFGLWALLNNDQIQKMISSYIGENKLFETMFLSGRLELELNPQGTLAERIRAGGAGIPAFYTRTGVGTVVAKDKEIREFGGTTYIMERSLRADLALIKGWKADVLGNVIYRKTARNFNPVMATAAETTIVEVEEIVPAGFFDPDNIHTQSIYVDRVIVGSHYSRQIEFRTTRPRTVENR